jgi:hypothetical protein
MDILQACMSPGVTIISTGDRVKSLKISIKQMDMENNKQNRASQHPHDSSSGRCHDSSSGRWVKNGLDEVSSHLIKISRWTWAGHCRNNAVILLG